MRKLLLFVFFSVTLVVSLTLVVVSLTLVVASLTLVRCEEREGVREEMVVVSRPADGRGETTAVTPPPRTAVTNRSQLVSNTNFCMFVVVVPLFLELEGGGQIGANPTGFASGVREQTRPRIRSKI